MQKTPSYTFLIAVRINIFHNRETAAVPEGFRKIPEDYPEEYPDGLPTQVICVGLQTFFIEEIIGFLVARLQLQCYLDRNGCRIVDDTMALVSRWLLIARLLFYSFLVCLLPV